MLQNEAENMKNENILPAADICRQPAVGSRLPVPGCRLQGRCRVTIPNSTFSIGLAQAFLLPGRTQLSLTGQPAYVPQTLAGQ